MTTSESTPPETSAFVQSLKRFTHLFGWKTPKQRNTTSKMEGLDFGLSEVFDILQPERRQAAIEVLADAEMTPLPTSKLAEEVAAIEYDCPPGNLNKDQRKRVYIALYQVHLPRLKEMDIVTYDRENQFVGRGDKFDEINTLYTHLLDVLSRN